MSKIIWSSLEIPKKDISTEDFRCDAIGDSFCVPQTKVLPIEERKVELPDKRAFRSMSRAGVLLSMVALRGKEVVDSFLKEDPFSVGIYCAVENGPVDVPSTEKMLDINKENFGEVYRTNRNPKMYLRQLPNLAAAHLGIFMGVLGPMHVFNSTKYGSFNALEKAEMDLYDGIVKCAIVCSAFSFENPITVDRCHRIKPKDSVLCEGAGAILLVKDDQEKNWKNFDYNQVEEYFGISQQIIETIMKQERTL